VLLDQRGAPPSSVLRSWLTELYEDGYSTVRTGAVHAEQRSPFVALGFESAQDLVLLHCDVSTVRIGAWRRASPSRPHDIRRARPGDLGALAALDTAAFPDGWGLDVHAITDAAGATAKHRVAVVDGLDGHPIAYSISGRSGQAAFLQRLAVEPRVQGTGVGRVLVIDSLRWAARWRVGAVAVNTQNDNHRALQLYESVGFVRRPNGLTVMQRALDGCW
jgi:GNAT superfamily N-acetyltransferase